MSRFSWEIFNKMPVVGIMRNVPAAAVEVIAKHYLRAGLTTLEITMNSEAAVKILSSLTAEYNNRLNIGAGTVLSLKDLEAALSAGAQFIVTPVLNEEVIKACVTENIPVFPGAYSPTEIYKAWKLGASMVKVFPASKLGVNYIKEVLAPMNFLKLLPTGGVTPDNCIDYLNAGAAAVALGSHLFPKSIIEEENWEILAARFKNVHDIIQAAKRE